MSTTAANEKGIASSVAHAEKTRAGWGADAADKIIHYATHVAKAGVPWSMEDVRIWAYANGLDNPPSERAWGAVVRRVSKPGLIQHVGFGVSADGGLRRTYVLAT